MVHEGFEKDSARVETSGHKLFFTILFKLNFLDYWKLSRYLCTTENCIPIVVRIKDKTDDDAS